jgi:hypothetical protein
MTYWPAVKDRCQVVELRLFKGILIACEVLRVTCNSVRNGDWLFLGEVVWHGQGIFGSGSSETGNPC